MLSESTDSIENKNGETWQVVIFSQNNDVINKFRESLARYKYNSTDVDLSLFTNVVDLKDKLEDLSNQSVIHIDGTYPESEEILKQIRRNPYCKHTYLVVWDDNPWEKYEMEFLRDFKINDVRSFTSMNKKRLAFIIDTNIRNQYHFISNFSIKEDLEIKIKDRLKAVTKLNKKLQTAIIQNSNINTKLHQQRNQIEKQNQEIRQRNEELEKAFKKSSRQHIKLHKALYENEQQREKLQKVLTEIQNKNKTLKAKNEEIIAQRDHIEQQHEEIQSQRDLALTQQEEINDNIAYASRIQSALFPPIDLLDQLLPQHFVLNRPKDVVSGDFYWIAQNRSSTIVAVADCTGHGISGAMMSMLGTAFLNEIVNKNDVTSSAQILEQLRERVISSLHQQIGDNIDYSRDGMDISVCNIDIVDNKLEYSGANNPIYILRNGDLIQLKPDKMPIGIHEFYHEPFHTEIVELVSGDVVYMFSDGFADQFGGERGKKMKYSRFKKLLMEHHTLDFREQKRILNQAFDVWRGNQEQIDDVLLLGFKIS